MTFSDFAKRLQLLELESSRLGITELLAQLYADLQSTERQPASYLLQGSLVPAYESMEFQLSVKMVLRAIARVREDQGITDLFGGAHSDQHLENVTRIYATLGDLGEVAQRIRAENKIEPKPASMLEVFSSLQEIAKASGSGSQERKLTLLSKLFLSLDPLSCRYVARIIVGKLRLGFSVMTMIDALSWVVTNSKKHHDILEKAYQHRADVGALAAFFLDHPLEDLRDDGYVEKVLKSFTVVAGTPVVPSLCQRLNSAQEIIDKMGAVIVEPKYDGLRIQIHKKNDVMKAYSRSLEDISHMFPELKKVASALSCESCIIDAEAIGYDSESDALLPFQDTITRKRKHDIATVSETVPIRFYAFDILELNGTSLIDMQLHERKQILRKLFKDSSSLRFTPVQETNDAVALRAMHDEFLADQLEGAVIKQRSSPYRSGRKGWRWVKIKEAEGTSGKLSDTLDLIIMGYYFGRGKRASFGLGAFLVGAVNEKEQVLTVAKIGTGISEAQLVQIKDLCDAEATSEMPLNYVVHKTLLPDVWVRPSLVVEIAADEITISPAHSAGIALRFPRLLKLRGDKKWHDATTLQEIQNIAALTSST